jgi:hypothetical protein
MRGKSSRCGRISEFSHASAVDHAMRAMREIRFMASDEISNRLRKGSLDGMGSEPPVFRVPARPEVHPLVLAY